MGNYFTTPIWEFTLKCHLCDNKMVIRTNPKASDYDFVSGCRKKDEDFTAADNETTELATAETKQRLVTDPFYKLEYAEADKRKAKTAAGVMHGTLLRVANGDVSFASCGCVGMHMSVPTRMRMRMRTRVSASVRGRRRRRRREAILAA